MFMRQSSLIDAAVFCILNAQQEILPAFANKKFEWLQFCIFAPWPLFVYTFITFRNKDSVL